MTFRQFFSSIICYFPVRRILQHDFKNMCSRSFGGNQLDSYNLQLCFKVIYWAFPCLQWFSLKWGAAETKKGLNAWSLYLGVIVIIVTFCFSFSWLLYTVHDTDLSFNGGHDFGSILYFRTSASFERTFCPLPLVSLFTNRHLWPTKFLQSPTQGPLFCLFDPYPFP